MIRPSVQASARDHRQGRRRRRRAARGGKPCRGQSRSHQNVRDQFDSESPTVGLRDSTWLIISVLVLTVTALAWGNPKGVDLFARLIVIGGGVTMAVAVAGRKFLVKD